MTDYARLAATIDAAFEERANFAPGRVPAAVSAAVESAIDLLDRGDARAAEEVDGEWIVHQWLKKAVLLSFRLNDNRPFEAGYTRFFDKVDLKYAGYVARQQSQVERQARLGEKRIPRGFDFRSLTHLRIEAREKLARIQPENLSQAIRISGITVCQSGRSPWAASSMR